MAASRRSTWVRRAHTEFLPLTLQATAAPAKAERDIRIEVRRSTGSVTVNWPLEGAASCAAWLRDWLR